MNIEETLKEIKELSKDTNQTAKELSKDMLFLIAKRKERLEILQKARNKRNSKQK